MSVLIAYQVSDEISERLAYQCSCRDVEYLRVGLELEGLSLREILGRRHGRLWQGEHPEGAMVVLCGMTQAQMDDMLNAMRAWRKERLLKAVLTPTNQHWTCPELLREIKQEDEAVRHG